jgi:hypothetical protein
VCNSSTAAGVGTAGCGRPLQLPCAAGATQAEPLLSMPPSGLCLRDWGVLGVLAACVLCCCCCVVHVGIDCTQARGGKACCCARALVPCCCRMRGCTALQVRVLPAPPDNGLRPVLRPNPIPGLQPTGSSQQGVLAMQSAARTPPAVMHRAHVAACTWQHNAAALLSQCS